MGKKGSVGMEFDRNAHLSNLNRGRVLDNSGTYNGPRSGGAYSSHRDSVVRAFPLQLVGRSPVPEILGLMYVIANSTDVYGGRE